jgi:hypothetical protein
MEVALWISCRFIEIPRLTGPVGQPFASHHRGAGVRALGAPTHTHWSWYFPVGVSCYKTIISQCKRQNSAKSSCKTVLNYLKSCRNQCEIGHKQGRNLLWYNKLLQLRLLPPGSSSRGLLRRRQLWFKQVPRQMNAFPWILTNRN